MRSVFVPLFAGETLADRLVFGFVVWSAVWITVSDYLVFQLPLQRNDFWWIQTTKGLVYVAISGCLIWIGLIAVRHNEGARRAINEHKLRALKESGLIGVCCWSADGTVSYVNGALLQMLGYREGELKGNVARLVTFSDKDAIAQQDFYLSTEQSSGLQEFALVRKDGTRVPVYGGSAVIGGNCERIAYFVDISRLKKSEQEKAQLRDQLMDVEKMNALSRLASGIAHNFNNELAIIVGYCSLIKSQSSADPNTVRSMEQVLKAAERSRQMIHRMLTFGRATTPRAKIVDLNKLILELMPAIRQILREGVDVRVKSSSDSQFVEIDSGQIEEAIMNLVINARDAMPHGGHIQIEIAHESRTPSAVVRDPANDRVLLKVSDTGIGMDAMTAQRVFEPFFTTKRETGGTGLGLASVLGIVKQNGGDISVVSQPGHGTVFTISFSKVANELGSDSETNAADANDMMQGNVLLIEDMDDLREMMAAILTSRGLAVSTARDGIEAVELVHRTDFQPDLIISDVVMPRMNGPEAVHLIRQRFPGVKVIYLSGHADLLGVDCKDKVIWKPVPPEALIRTIRNYLQHPPPTLSREAA